jgi:four helix bundle protein
MSSTAAAPDVVPDGLPPLDPQRLDCYRVAVDFCALAAHLIPARGHRELRDQLARASLSISLNIAEGVGRTSALDKAHFFSIARGSAMECGAIADAGRSLGLISVGSAKQAGWLVVRLVQMLTKLEAAARRR